MYLHIIPYFSTVPASGQACQNAFYAVCRILTVLLHLFYIDSESCCAFLSNHSFQCIIIFPLYRHTDRCRTHFPAAPQLRKKYTTVQKSCQSNLCISKKKCTFFRAFYMDSEVTCSACASSFCFLHPNAAHIADTPYGLFDIVLNDAVALPVHLG